MNFICIFCRKTVNPLQLFPSSQGLEILKACQTLHFHNIKPVFLPQLAFYLTDASIRIEHLYAFPRQKQMTKLTFLYPRRSPGLTYPIWPQKVTKNNWLSSYLQRLSQILILINMNQTKPQNVDVQALNLTQARVNHLNYFFQVKENLKCLTRQTLFLGIAICDKFFEKSKKQEKQASELHMDCELRVLTCLWTAWKFIETDKIPIKKLLQKAKASITSQEVIQMEAQILQRIEFEIPTDTAYATMTIEFNSAQVDKRNAIVIAGQCIKFLMEALKFSTDFSLCAELGPKILMLYRQRCLQDVRIRSVYAKIQQKMGQKEQNAIKVN